jgi:hypothetical protein
MDFDPEVEELDSFDLLLPLPYRLAILIVLGVWLWGLNLHGLHLLNIVGHIGSLKRHVVSRASTHHSTGYTALNTLPFALLANSNSPSLLCIPLCNRPLYTVRGVTPLVLDPHAQ